MGHTVRGTRLHEGDCEKAGGDVGRSPRRHVRERERMRRQVRMHCPRDVRMHPHRDVRGGPTGRFPEATRTGSGGLVTDLADGRCQVGAGRGGRTVRG